MKARRGPLLRKTALQERAGRPCVRAAMIGAGDRQRIPPAQAKQKFSERILGYEPECRGEPLIDDLHLRSIIAGIGPLRPAPNPVGTARARP